MAVLSGYKNIRTTCGSCGGNYIAIESTDDPEVVLLRCWCGSTCKAPRDHQVVKQVLGDPE